MFIIFIFSFIANLFSQNINISATIDRTEISLDEQAEITVTVSGNVRGISKPVVPDLPDFSIYQAGTSQNISIINGNVQSSFSYRFVLTPKKIGEFTIPPFKIKYRGRYYQSQTLKLKVVKPQQIFKKQNQYQPSQSQSQEAPEIFVDQKIDKKVCYVGEQITYTFYFFRRVNLLSNPSFNPPNFKGFLKEDLPPNKTYYKNFRGYQYLVTEVKYALFPLKSGDYVIREATLDVAIDDLSFFDDFFRDDFFKHFFSGTKTKRLATRILRLKVLPLPYGKPDDFTLGVGKFNLKVFLDKYKVKKGEPVTFNIELYGRGDPRPLKLPKFPTLTNFKVFETVSSLNLTKKNYVVGGSKTFKTLLIPQISGKLKIPEITLSYFDPREKKYKTLKTPVLELEVLKSEVKKEVLGTHIPKGELQVVREDIRHIMKSEGKREKGFLYRKNIFKILVLFPLVCWIFGIIFKNFYFKVYVKKIPEIEKRKAIKELLLKAEEKFNKNNLYEFASSVNKISENLKDTPDDIKAIIEKAREILYSPYKTGVDVKKEEFKKFKNYIKKII